MESSHHAGLQNYKKNSIYGLSGPFFLIPSPSRCLIFYFFNVPDAFFLRFAWVISYLLLILQVENDNSSLSMCFLFACEGKIDKK